MRGRQAPKRIVEPDPIYGSRLVAKFINHFMYDGKKSTAQHLFYKALDIIKEESKQDPLQVFEKALKAIAPKMEVRPRRVGGASYQVPIEVRGDRKETLAVRWIIAAARTRGGANMHTFDKKLAAELMDAANGAGGAAKKRDDVQRMAAANRAFSHFRW